MGSVGELFIQLGVLGNANELRKANQEFQKANILAKKQAELEKLRAEYLERIQKAQDKAEKRRLAQEYRAKKALIEQKANLDIKNLEHKALKANIAQWATYAHAVSMAASVVIGSIKKICEEIENVTAYGQNMINIGMTTSAPIPELQKYGRVAHALNPNISEAQMMQQMAKINQAYDFYKAGNPQKLFSMMNGGGLAQLGASGFYRDVLNRKVPNATAFLERLRTEIQGKSPERQTNILREAGLDESLLPMLNMSKQDFDNYAARLQENALTEEQLEKQAKFAREINAFKQTFDDFKQRLFGELAPIYVRFLNFVEQHIPDIIKAVNDFLDYLKATFTKEDLKKMINALKYLGEKLVDFVKAISKFFSDEADKHRKNKDDKEKALKDDDKKAFVDAATKENVGKTSMFGGFLAGLTKWTPGAMKFIPALATSLFAADSYISGRRNAEKEWDRVTNITNNINQENQIFDRDAADRVNQPINNVTNSQLTQGT